MITRLTGAYGAVIRDLTLDHDDTWMRGLAIDTDARDGSVEVCLPTLSRYRTHGSSVERAFATLIAAIICATASDTTLTPAPTGAEVIAALHRGGDSKRESALLAACHQLIAGT